MGKLLRRELMMDLDLYHSRSKQRQVKKITWQAKRECKKDMAKNIKHNSKVFFKYIRGQEQVRTRQNKKNIEE